MRATRATRSRGLLDDVNVLRLYGGVIHLNPDELDLQLQLHGSTGTYWSGITCPCVHASERQPDPTCAHCRGQGYLYPPQNAQRMIVLDVQRSSTERLIASGSLPSGTVQLTFPSSVIPAWGDLWMPDGEEHVVEEVLSIRAPLPRHEVSMYRASSDSRPVPMNAPAPRLLYPHLREVEMVTYLERATDGTSRVCYAPPTEYHIDDEGRFTWRDGAGPPVGQVWTIRYRAPAAFRLFNVAPRYRTEADQRMPHAVTARRLDRVSPNDFVPVVQP